jgi:hypothetical protein
VVGAGCGCGCGCGAGCDPEPEPELEPEPEPDAGCRIGAIASSFACSGVTQSLCTSPPVSPLSGLNDQNEELIPVVFRYDTRVVSHCWSLVVASFVPNSPSSTGAMPFFAR